MSTPFVLVMMSPQRDRIGRYTLVVGLWPSHVSGAISFVIHCQVETRRNPREVNRCNAGVSACSVSRKTLVAPRSFNRCMPLRSSTRPSSRLWYVGRVPITPISPTEYSPRLSDTPVSSQRQNAANVPAESSAITSRSGS